MKLSSEQKKIFENWIRERVGSHSCPLCHSNNWKVGELLVGHSQDVLDDLASLGPTMAQLICQKCANVLLFDVRIVDKWEKGEAPHSSAIM